MSNESEGWQVVSIVAAVAAGLVCLAVCVAIGVVRVHRSRDEAITQCVAAGRAPLECKAALERD